MNRHLPGLAHSVAARLNGIHAATICPMRPDGEIDEGALAAHIAAVAGADGIQGLLVNGHAGENYLLDAAEKRRVLEIARTAAGTSAFLVAGVNAEASRHAAREAADAQAAGADAILLFPPNSWALAQDPEAVLLHHRRVIDACDLPVILYQAPVGAGRMAYPVATLEKLAALPRVIAVKEGSWEVATYEENRRALLAVRPDFIVLGSGDEHLLASYLVGSAGSQVSLAAVAPAPVVALWRAAAAGDWNSARHWHDVIYPLAGAIYRIGPAGRATQRLKACLKILGRLACDHARAPQAPLPPEEYRRLEAALMHAMAGTAPATARNAGTHSG